MLDTMRGVWTHDRPKVRTFKDGRPVRWAQPKRDGHRLTFFMQADDDNGLCVFGKLMEADLELSHILDWHPAYKTLLASMPPRSSVDCECWLPGRPASAVRTAMLNRDYTLRIDPFAIPYWVGVPVHRMQEAMGIDTGLPFIDTRHYDPDIDWLNAWDDTEGAVLKEDHYTGWWKHKRVQTVDLVCTGVKEGKGKFDGQVGSLHGSVYRKGVLVEVACVSGMDDALRAALSAGDVGRVFEVAYDYVGEGDRLRFPRFVRWRDEEKLPIHCTWEDQL